MSNRAKRWQKFSDAVVKHIEEYTVPQYGDYPTDLLTTYDEAQLIKSLQKYLKRLESNKRGQEEKVRDCFKIAHYASELWWRRTWPATSNTTKSEEEIKPVIIGKEDEEDNPCPCDELDDDGILIGEEDPTGIESGLTSMQDEEFLDNLAQALEKQWSEVLKNNDDIEDDDDVEIVIKIKTKKKKGVVIDE